MQVIQSIKARLVSVVVAGPLAAVLVGVGSASAQTTPQTDLVGTIQKYVAAFNTADTAAMRTMLDPSYQYVTTN